MALIANVVTGGTITAAWGNAIRDTTVQNCTSSTRPSSPAEGMVIYETDTDRLLVYSGSAWVRFAVSAAAGRTGCALRRASSLQTITNASYQQILYDTEDYDSDGFITASSGSPAGTVTIPTGLDGLYAITAQIWTGSAAGQDGVIQHFTTVGGLAYAYSYSFGPPPRSTGWPSAPNQGYPFGDSITIRMIAGDTLKVVYYQSSGASQTAGALLTVDRVGL